MKKLVFALLIAGSSIYCAPSPQSLNREFLDKTVAKLRASYDEEADTETNFRALNKIANIILRQQGDLWDQVSNLTRQMMEN